MLTSPFVLHLGEKEIQEAKKRKDKGKAVVEDTIVLQSEPPIPLTNKLSSATGSGVYSWISLSPEGKIKCEVNIVVIERRIRSNTNARD